VALTIVPVGACVPPHNRFSVKDVPEKLLMFACRELHPNGGNHSARRREFIRDAMMLHTD
jgi:hypothetical protein